MKASKVLNNPTLQINAHIGMILDPEQHSCKLFSYQFVYLFVWCLCRYKIYIEGYAWSVSEKYILACDSVTFIVQPQFYDFFMRSMQPVEHYWPIRNDDKCRSLKFAVDWGNNHKKKVPIVLNI